jgi:hypothetical protein
MYWYTLWTSAADDEALSPSKTEPKGTAPAGSLAAGCLANASASFQSLQTSRPVAGSRNRATEGSRGAGQRFWSACGEWWLGECDIHSRKRAAHVGTVKGFEPPQCNCNSRCPHTAGMILAEARRAMWNRASVQSAAGLLSANDHVTAKW